MLMCRCRAHNSHNRKKAKRSRRCYERRDSPFDSDYEDVEPGPLFVMYPQLGEHDPAFIAVERDERGHENCRIFRRGKVTALWSCHFPPHVYIYLAAD